MRSCWARPAGRIWAGGVLWFILAGLAIGALRPTNTWDLPTYLALGLVGTVYAVWHNYRPDRELVDRQALRERGNLLADFNPRLLRLLATAGSAAVLAGLALLLYQPYAQWYALGYTQLDLWAGHAYSHRRLPVPLGFVSIRIITLDGLGNARLAG